MFIFSSAEGSRTQIENTTLYVFKTGNSNSLLACTDTLFTLTEMVDKLAPLKSAHCVV